MITIIILIVQDIGDFYETRFTMDISYIFGLRQGINLLDQSTKRNTLTQNPVQYVVWRMCHELRFDAYGRLLWTTRCRLHGTSTTAFHMTLGEAANKHARTPI